MPSIDLTDPNILKFYTENFEKESRSRILWNDKHKKIIEQAATLKRAPKNYRHTDGLAHKMKSGMTALSRDHKTSFRYRKTVPNRDPVPLTTKDLKYGNSLVAIGLGDPKEDPRLTRPATDATPDPLMRPIDSKVSELLYKPRPNFGRVAYLAKRTEKLPEDRYYLPECVSWNYGWRLKDSKLTGPEYGRYWCLMRALNNNSGAQPDPKHYGPMRNIDNPVPCLETS